MTDSMILFDRVASSSAECPFPKVNKPSGQRKATTPKTPEQSHKEHRCVRHRPHSCPCLIRVCWINLPYLFLEFFQLPYYWFLRKVIKFFPVLQTLERIWWFPVGNFHILAYISQFSRSTFVELESIKWVERLISSQRILYLLSQINHRQVYRIKLSSSCSWRYIYPYHLLDKLLHFLRSHAVNRNLCLLVLFQIQ